MTITSTEPTVAALREALRTKIAQGMRFAGVFAARRDGVITLSAHVAGPDGIDTLEAPLPPGAASYPAFTPEIGAAFWYERVIRDETGVIPDGHPRLAPLTAPGRPEDHALPRHVAGYGMFTIPHGPVRSGVFESMEYLVETPGEAIPHLNMRIFYKHREIAARFNGMTVSDGVLLAERAEASPPSPTPLPTATRSSRLPAARFPARPAWSASCTPSLSGSPTTSTSRCG